MNRTAIRWATVFLDVPEDLLDASVAFWSALTATTPDEWRGSSAHVCLLTPRRGDPVVGFRRLPRGAPHGVHLDLHVDGEVEALGSAAWRAVAGGATLHHQESHRMTLTSPGGFPFCLVPWGGETSVPDPVRFPSAGAAALDQVSLDIPAPLLARERAFWEHITGWPQRQGSRPEFSAFLRPDGIAVRLLLQRRDESGPEDVVTGHLDLATEDRAALSVLNVGGGSSVVRTCPNWISMTDPTGRAYCLTARDPWTGVLRTSA